MDTVLTQPTDPDRPPVAEAAPGEAGPSELGRFLRARREGVRPEDAGLPPGAGTRRTPGLRREEMGGRSGLVGRGSTRPWRA
jgi:hypothetical protein